MSESLKSQGERLRNRRESRLLSRAQLAEMAGVTIQTIQRIESGESDPRLATKRRIAEALGWVPESYDNPIEPDHPELSTRIEQIETRLDALESRSALTDNQELSPSQQALLAAFIRSL